MDAKPGDLIKVANVPRDHSIYPGIGFIVSADREHPHYMKFIVLIKNEFRVMFSDEVIIIGKI